MEIIGCLLVIHISHSSCRACISLRIPDDVLVLNVCTYNQIAMEKLIKMFYGSHFVVRHRTVLVRAYFFTPPYAYFAVDAFIYLCVRLFLVMRFCVNIRYMCVCVKTQQKRTIVLWISTKNLFTSSSLMPSKPHSFRKVVSLIQFRLQLFPSHTVFW